MDRFFSKLDLRDIKIDPRGNRFPPDETAYEGPVTTDEPTGEDAPADEPRNGYYPSPTHADEPLAAGRPAPADVDDWDTPPDLDAPPTSAEHAPRNGVDRRPTRDDLGALVESDGDVLKVSARSRPSAVAGAIAGVVREAGRAEVQAIGAGATNQAVKAVAIARDYLRETGIEAVCLPAFIDITIDNEDRTAIRLVIEPR